MYEDIWPAAFNCFIAFLLVVFVFAAAQKSEVLYRHISAFVMKRLGRPVPEEQEPGVRAMFLAPLTLPRGAFAAAAISAPILAVSALITLCAGLPFCTYIPITDSGDVGQMAQMLLLSEAFAAAALCSLGTKEALDYAAGEMKSALKLLFPLAAAAASLASYFVQNGVDRDPFSLSSFSVAGRFSSMSAFGICGTFLFAYVILSQIPGMGASFSGSLLKEGDIPGFGGAPRALLRLWAAARSFIVISVVVFVFFPYNLVDSIGEGAGIAWYGQTINFAAFWSAVVLCRLFVVPLCQMSMRFMERRLPARSAAAVMPFLTLLAMALLWYEGTLLIQEAAMF